MDISTGSISRRQTSVHADKQKKPWSISSSDIGNGLSNGSYCYDVLVLTRTIFSSVWAENRLLIVSNRHRIWRQYKSQYGLLSPRVDSTLSNRIDQDNDTLLLTNLHQPPCATDGRRASTAEDRILNI